MSNLIRDDDKRIAWDCKIGCADGVEVPLGGDAPMRSAVYKAFKELTGKEPDAIFSGWGASFSKIELGIIKNDGDLIREGIAVDDKNKDPKIQKLELKNSELQLKLHDAECYIARLEKEIQRWKQTAQNLEHEIKRNI